MALLESFLQLAPTDRMADCESRSPGRLAKARFTQVLRSKARLLSGWLSGLRSLALHTAESWIPELSSTKFIVNNATLVYYHDHQGDGRFGCTDGSSAMPLVDVILLRVNYVFWR
jgi:hypothetical protein